MVLLDAYALIAFLGDEPAGPEVERLLREQRTAITAVNLAEVVDGLQRLHGLPASEVASSLDLLLSEMELHPVAATEAWDAGRLRARHYQRRSAPLSLADSFLLAAAGPDDAIATSDPVVAEIGRLEQIEIVPLPDSAGRLP